MKRLEFYRRVLIWLFSFQRNIISFYKTCDFSDSFQKIYLIYISYHLILFIQTFLYIILFMYNDIIAQNNTFENILKILTISWRSLRHYVEEISKKNETNFSLVFWRVHDLPFSSSSLFERCDIFSSVSQRSPAASVSIFWIPRLEYTSLFRRFECARERKKSERRQEGIITGTRPFAVDRDEESEASICLLRGVFHPFIGFVNFATGYVITGQAKPRKSVRGRKRERERMKEGKERNWRS